MSTLEVNYIHSVSESLTSANFSVWDARLSQKINNLNDVDLANEIEAVQSAWGNVRHEQSNENLSQFKETVRHLNARRLELVLERMDPNQAAPHIEYDDDEVGNAALAVNQNLVYDHLNGYPNTRAAFDRIHAVLEEDDDVRMEDLIEKIETLDGSILHEKGPFLIFWSAIAPFRSFEEYQVGEIPEILEGIRNQVTLQMFDSLKNKNIFEFFEAIGQFPQFKNALIRLSYQPLVRNLIIEYIHGRMNANFDQPVHAQENAAWREFEHLSRYPHVYLQKFIDLHPPLYDYMDPLWKLVDQSGEYEVDEIGCYPDQEKVVVSFKEKGSELRIVVKVEGQFCSIGFYQGDQFIQNASVEALENLKDQTLRRVFCRYRIGMSIRDTINYFFNRFVAREPGV